MWVSQAVVSKYMIRRPTPPSQNWRTFLDNHLFDLVSADFFTVPSATFRVLFVFVVLAHHRRRVVHFNVTAYPYAEWTAQQIVEAFPWDTIILDEQHLRRILKDYFTYYQFCRAHLSLKKDAPTSRPVEPPFMGKIVAIPKVGGLHHRYTRHAA